MAYINSVDPDQTVCHSVKYFKNQVHKKQTQAKTVWNKVFKILDIYLHVYPRTDFQVVQLLVGGKGDIWLKLWEMAPYDLNIVNRGIKHQLRQNKNPICF